MLNHRLQRLQKIVRHRKAIDVLHGKIDVLVTDMMLLEPKNIPKVLGQLKPKLA